MASLLMNTFGVKELKEFQKETANNLLDGKDVYPF